MSRHRQHTLRRLVFGMLAGLPILVVGCMTPRLPCARDLSEFSQAGSPQQTTNTGQEPLAPAVIRGNPLPIGSRDVQITFDTVFRLADTQNPKIGLAREKLHESILNNGGGWLPNVYAGVAYYRHEGGIQNEDGRLTHSSTGALYPALNVQTELDLHERTFQGIDRERKVWQQKAELSQVNNEVLLEAATTYVDLLTARRGEAVARELEVYEKKLLDRAERSSKEIRGVQVVVSGIRASLSAREQAIAKLKQQGNAASAKLVYLLGLPPDACLVPMDLVFAPIELADSSLPAERLIELAQEGGPGINELRGLLDIIQDGIDKSYGSQNLLPSMLLTLGEGVIGAGPGGTMNWDNRFDVSVQLRWNLTRIFTADQQRQLARSKQNQALFSYHDLQGKLAAGVREARDAIHNGRLIIGLALNQIKESNTNYRQSNERLDGGVPNAMSEVALSIRALDLAHFNHLRAINEHNKAQIRLLLLMGDNAIPPMKAEVPPMSVPQRTSRPTGFGIDPAQGRQLPKPRQLPEELD